MEEIMEWVKLIRTDGLAVGLVVFFMVAFVIVIRWCGHNLLLPMLKKMLEIGDAHISFLTESTKATQAIGQNVNAVVSTQEAHGDKIEEIHEVVVMRRIPVDAVNKSVSPPNA